jgi:hypothetical protein
VYERNWAFSFATTYVPSTALDNTRHILWALKAMLCGQYGGFTQGLWQVYSSCDSVTAGNADGPGAGGSTDRWLSTYDGTKIVRGASGANIKSWVVLKSPLMNGINWYLIIAFESSADANASYWLAKGAPTGGTTTVVPTSLTQWVIGAGVSGATTTATGGATYYQNMCLSETGDFLYFPCAQSAGWCALFIGCVAPVGCHPNDPYPMWTHKYFQNSVPGAFLSTALHGGTSASLTLSPGSVSHTQAIASLLLVNDTSLGDSLTSKYYVLPAYVTPFLSTSWCMRGRLPDISIMPAVTAHPTNGTIFRDENGDIAYVSAGPLVIPANVVPVLR